MKGLRVCLVYWSFWDDILVILRNLLLATLFFAFFVSNPGMIWKNHIAQHLLEHLGPLGPGPVSKAISAFLRQTFFKRGFVRG